MLSVSYADSATQIPFWLLVTSISLAPILGFVGVAIGAILTGRSQRRAWVSDGKHKAYQEFLAFLAQITAFYGTEFRTAVRTKNEERLSELSGARRSMLEDLHRTHLQIRLIGSPSALAAADEIHIYLGLATALSAKALKGNFENSEWDRLIKLGLDIQSEFTDAARRDLVLPRRGRRLPKIRRSESTTDARGFALSAMQDIVPGDISPDTEPEGRERGRRGSQPKSSEHLAEQVGPPEADHQG